MDAKFESLIKVLEHELNKKLPGLEAQLKMAPKHREIALKYLPKQIDVKKGSVMILLFPDEGKIIMPLMQRPDYDGAHSGQISFPGGKMDEVDEDLIATALRETREEIGVSEDEITVLGNLTELYIPISNFSVLPVVGYCKNKPFFLPDQYEVVHIIEADVLDLVNNLIVKEKIIKATNGIETEAPFYDIKGNVVWGATAMILSEFLTIIEQNINNRTLNL